MKKISFIAIIASVLLACNPNSNHDPENTNTVKHDSAGHATHTAENQMNPVKATMDKMMQEMHAAKPTGNNDIDFAAMMLEHHKGAVEMSKVEIEKGSNAEMKAFAQKVITDQNKEIAFMQDFMSKATKTSSSNSAAFQKALQQSMMAMMSDNTKIYNDIDKDFAAQMIPHHQSAVDMAKAYLQYGHENSLTTLSRNIINSQEKEIKWLNEWLVKNGK